jgi:hypothetical protein
MGEPRPYLPPLPPVDLSSGDLGGDELDDAPPGGPSLGDDDDPSELELENVADPAARRRHGRLRAHARRPRGRHGRQAFEAPRLRAPRIIVVPRRHPQAMASRGRQVLVLRESPADRADHHPRDRDAHQDGRAHGGLLVTGGGTRYFGVVPEGGIMPGARLQLATPLPTLPGATSSSGWLSSATVGLSGGFDAGTSGGVDAQLWHAGVVLAMGAPWTRDFIGVALEGGVLGGHYWDGNDVATSQVQRQTVPGPHGEGIDPKPYGLARLTLQIPLRNDVRPFLAGDLGMTERTGDRLASIVGIHAGIVWNAW